MRTRILAGSHLHLGKNTPPGISFVAGEGPPPPSTEFTRFLPREGMENSGSPQLHNLFHSSVLKPNHVSLPTQKW